MLSMIVAVGPGGAIGAGGKLPWERGASWERADRFHFRAVTTGHTLIMGRRTWESIGQPLKNRRIVVLSRSPMVLPPTVMHASTPLEALALASVFDRNPIVAGGAEIYSEFLPLAQRIWWTQFTHPVPAADTFMAPLDLSTWHESDRWGTEGVWFQVFDRNGGIRD